MTTYPGNTIRIKATFKDADAVLVNPSTVALLIKPPEGDIVTYTQGELTNPSEGVWYGLYTPSLPGHYDVRWQTDLPGIATETYFDVQPSRF